LIGVKTPILAVFQLYRGVNIFYYYINLDAMWEIWGTPSITGHMRVTLWRYALYRCSGPFKYIASP